MSVTTQPIDEGKLDEFLGRFVGDLGAALSSALVVIGDKLGLYRQMGDGTPLTAEELASRTGTDARYVREWLSNQAAGGYVSYDPATERFYLTAEQSFALAQEGSPAFIPGAFQLATSLIKDEEKITAAFRSGAGVGWHEHHHDLFAGTERFFRPGYVANLVPAWIPALDGVEAKLEAGARVADVGCGHGASTIVMAQAYPRSQFVGFDYHAASIEHARAAAAEAGVDGRVTFEVAPAKEYPGRGYDLVAMFDCLHDMGDPVGAAAHVLETLGRRWHLAGRRALRRGPARGQPQPGRPGVLRRVDASLHPCLARARGGPRARGASRRAAAARRGYGWRLHPLPPRRADAIQHRARGAAMICTLTARRLKPESYDAFRTAWDPGRPPDGWTHIYHCRDVADPDVVISFGLFNGSVAGAARGASPEGRQSQVDRIGPHVEQVLLDGSYEVVEELTP